MVVRASGQQVSAPTSVGKLTVAVDGWGANELDPWSLSTVAFLQDYFNLRLMGQDEEGKPVPLWATEAKLTDDGVHFTLNPKARWQDGRPATAEDLKMNFADSTGFCGWGNVGLIPLR
jgi:ABC-type transport system substrate-binding protein